MHATILLPSGQIYSDQMGKFVTPSGTGNNYVMVVYDYDRNYIFVQPFRNQTSQCLLTTYTILHQRLCKAGLQPKLQRMFNYPQRIYGG